MLEILIRKIDHCDSLRYSYLYEGTFMFRVDKYNYKRKCHINIIIIVINISYTCDSIDIICH